MYASFLKKSNFRFVKKDFVLLSADTIVWIEMQGAKDLTNGPIGQQLFRLALPIMASSFIQMAYSLTDMAWVGRIGSEASAAVGAVGILVWTTNALSLLGKVGSEVSVGQSIGVSDWKAARSFASHNLTLSFLVALLWGTLLFVLARPIMELFGMEASITTASVSYLSIVSTAFPFIFLSVASMGIYNAAGRSTIPFWINGSGLLLNIVLDPVFIFVFGWGTDGAAWATWLSQAIVCLLFVWNLKRQNRLFEGFPLFVRLRKMETLRIFRLGFPVALFNVLFSFVSLFLSREAARYGGHLGVMALTTGGQIEAVTWTTSQGLSTALSAFISQNYAARKINRVLKAWKTTLWMSGFVGGVITILFVSLGPEIFSLFVPEKTAYEAGGIYLRISGYSQLFMMLEITTQGVFYGTGRTIPPAVTSIVLNYARIPLAWFLCQYMGVEGIWWAVTLSSIAKGCVLVGWFSLKRKHMWE